MFAEAAETEKESCVEIKCSASSVPKKVGKGGAERRHPDDVQAGRAGDPAQPGI